MPMRVLRDAHWITLERIRVYSLFSIAALIGAFGYLVATSHGLNDYQGRPLGVDFSNVYAAGTYALKGTPELAFDPAQQFVREQAIFGEKTQLYGWHYPPLFLAVAAALATLPYFAALSFWETSTFVAYIWAMRIILPMRAAVLPIVGFTAVWINALNGNNGFLTAALFGGALALLPTRRIAAGIMLGCLAYKPQYGLLIPFALIAGHHWRVLWVTGFTVFTLIGFSLWGFGLASWQAFFRFLPFTQQQVLEQGNTGFYKMQSLFAWARDLGMNVNLAYGLQSMLTLFVIVAILRVWSRPYAWELKAALLLLGTVLGTPYVLDYDLMLLAPAMAYLIRYSLKTEFPPYEKIALLAAWGMPLIARNVAHHSWVFLGVLTMLLLFGLTLRKCSAVNLETTACCKTATGIDYP